jgi:hypothetical protein
MMCSPLLLLCLLPLQLALYDVRRLSSKASSVINFGGSRASQQLIASFNLPPRADEAAAAAAAPTDGSGTSMQAAPAAAAGRIFPFFRDISLNPEDPNLVAYVRPDLQVWSIGLWSFAAAHIIMHVYAYASDSTFNAAADTVCLLFCSTDCAPASASAALPARLACLTCTTTGCCSRCASLRCWAALMHRHRWRLVANGRCA